MITNLKEKIEFMKKGYLDLLSKADLPASARRQGILLDVQEAHFDSGMAADPAIKEDFENDEEILPDDFEKIS